MRPLMWQGSLVAVVSPELLLGDGGVRCTCAGRRRDGVVAVGLKGQPGHTFAERLNHLFETVRPAGKGSYTYEQVSAGVAEAGYEISPAYVWQLRRGERANPTLYHIEGLAAFFGVPASYFLDPAVEDRVNKQLELLASLRDAGVRNVALRAHGLSPKGLAALETMIDRLRDMENLEVQEHEDHEEA